MVVTGSGVSGRPLPEAPIISLESPSASAEISL